MNRDHMTHFQKLSGIRPTLPSLEEEAKRMSGLAFEVIDMRGQRGFPEGDEGLVYHLKLEYKLKDKYTGEEKKWRRQYVIRTDHKNKGWRIDEVAPPMPAEAVPGLESHYKTPQAAAKALAGYLKAIRDKGTYVESIDEALGVPDLNKWKITQKGGKTFYTVKLHGKTVTVREVGEPPRSGLYRYRIFIDGKQYQKQDETEVKGVMRTVEKAVMGESIDLSEGAEEFRAAVSRIIPDPKEFRKLAKKYRVEIVLETHQAWNKKGGGISFHVKLPDGKYKLYSPGGPGGGSYLETASSASNYGPEGLMVGWSPEAQAKWGKSEDVGDSDESEVTEAAGAYFVLVDVSKPGGRLVSKKLFQGLPGLKKADAVVEKLRAKGRDVQVIDAAWYAPADELVAAATKGEAAEESEDVDDLDEGQPYDSEEDPRTYSDKELHSFMDLVHSEAGVGGVRKLGKAAYKKYAAAKREMKKRGLKPRWAAARESVETVDDLDEAAPRKGAFVTIGQEFKSDKVTGSMFEAVAGDWLEKEVEKKASWVQSQVVMKTGYTPKEIHDAFGGEPAFKDAIEKWMRISRTNANMIKGVKDAIEQKARDERQALKARNARRRAHGEDVGRDDGTESLTEELRLSKGDKKVIAAFIDQKSGTSKKLHSDGRRLDGLWMGGRGIATWEGGKIALEDPPGRAVQKVQKMLRQMAPKNMLAVGMRESVEPAAIADGSALITEDIRRYRVLAGMDPLPSRR